MPGPVPFVQHIDGKFVLADGAEEILSKIHKPVAVIAVAGLYRTGGRIILSRSPTANNIEG